METESNIPTAQRFATIGRAARAGSMFLALVAGILHIAMLWQQPLSPEVMLEAGRGVLLLLLAMGLMGTARLSLILAISFGATSLFTIESASDTTRWLSMVEVTLIILALSALLISLTEEQDAP